MTEFLVTCVKKDEKGVIVQVGIDAALLMSKQLPMKFGIIKIVILLMQWDTG